MVNLFILPCFSYFLLFSYASHETNMDLDPNECNTFDGSNKLVKLNLPDSWPNNSELSYETKLTGEQMKNFITIKINDEIVQEFIIYLFPDSNSGATIILKKNSGKGGKIYINELPPTFNVTIKNIGEAFRIYANGHVLGEIKFRIMENELISVIIESKDSPIEKSCYFTEDNTFKKFTDGHLVKCLDSTVDKASNMKLENGFTEGKKISISGFMGINATSFELEIINADQTVIFWLCVNFTDNTVILDQASKFDDNYSHYGDQKIMPNLWFKPNTTFKIDIIKELKIFTIFVDDSIMVEYSTYRLCLFGSGNLSVAFIRFSGDAFAQTACYYENITKALINFTQSNVLADDCQTNLEDKNIHEIGLQLPELFKTNQSLYVYGKTYPYMNDIGLNVYMYSNISNKTIIGMMFMSKYRKLSFFGVGKRGVSYSSDYDIVESNQEFNLTISKTNKGYQIFYDGFDLLTINRFFNSSIHYIAIDGDISLYGVCLRDDN